MATYSEVLPESVGYRVLPGRRVRLIALHGFLGSPNDWARVFADVGDLGEEAFVHLDDEIIGRLDDKIIGRLDEEIIARFDDKNIASLDHEIIGRLDEEIIASLDVEVFAPDLLVPLRNPDVRTWDDYIKYLLAQVAAESVPGSQELHSEILVGYSLGGRVALHLLAAAPERWAGAILVSTHPGLSDQVLAAQRCAADLQWGERLRNEAWDQFLHAWHQQPVFRGSIQGPNAPDERDRQHWARALEILSLGRQQDFRRQLQTWNVPITWIAGANDDKFLRLLRDLFESGHTADAYVGAHAGHRLPWDQPELFRQFVRAWLSRTLLGGSVLSRSLPSRSLPSRSLPSRSLPSRTLLGGSVLSSQGINRSQRKPALLPGLNVSGFSRMS